MKKFIVIYHAGPVAMEQMQNTNPEAGKEVMQKWMEWSKNYSIRQ